MKEGDSIRFVDGTGSPFHGKARGIGAALLCCGAKLYGSKPLLDHVEEIEGQPVRRHRWIFDADTKLEFKPDFAAEEITVEQLVQRFESEDWCREHPHHPISHLRAFFDQILIMEERRKTWRPCLLVRNGSCYALLGPDMTEEEKQEALSKLAAA